MGSVQGRLWKVCVSVCTFASALQISRVWAGTMSQFDCHYGFMFCLAVDFKPLPVDSGGRFSHICRVVFPGYRRLCVCSL